ncbi:MAG: hypothetical protein AAF985_11500 [Bacteroidota bacterium]
MILLFRRASLRHFGTEDFGANLLFISTFQHISENRWTLINRSKIAATTTGV